MKEIKHKIVGFSVKTADEKEVAPVAKAPALYAAGIERPDMVQGCTYKIKTPHSDHALYVTVNWVHLEDENGNVRPRLFEVFCESKNAQYKAYLSVITRLASANMRQNYHVRFIADELLQIHEPNGGYHIPKSGGVWVGSVIAHVGYILGKVMDDLGIDIDPSKQELKVAAQQVIADKLAKKAEKPEGKGRQCSSCGEHSVIRMDGCDICTSCGSSKCG